MNRKLMVILVLSILCISSFSFAAREEDFQISLKVTENRLIVFDDIDQEL